MPELPEVETTRRGLEPLLAGRTIVHIAVRAPKLRQVIPTSLAHLKGVRVTQITRRAKYILIHLDNAKSLIVHLGMTGGFFKRTDNDAIQRHDHIVFYLDNTDIIAFHDPRRFGLMDLAPTGDLTHHSALADLGPEPLEDSFTPAILRRMLGARKTSIKAALLDQSVVAGLGNIYVSEALFGAGIHPESPANTLTAPAIKHLHHHIQKVLRAALKAGGSTLRDYQHPSGELGFFQDQFAVYDRASAPCPGCTCRLNKTGGIQRIVQNGRSTYFCATKQKLSP
jgi:formamidopyrimidine-DNA glycosylase